MAIVLLAHAAIALAIVSAFFGGRLWLLRVAGFTLPLSGLVLAGDVGWSWTRLLPALLTVGAALLPGGRPLRQLPGRGALLALLGWSLAVTVGFRVGDFELGELLEVGKQHGWGPAQCEYRHAVQWLVELGNWAILVAAFRLSASPRDARGAVDGFIFGNLLSVLVGLYQAVAVGMGLPWLQREDAAMLNGNLGMGDLGGQALALGPLRVARLYGLGGEPKHTAALAVMALGLLLARDLAGARGRFDRPIMATLAVGVALTLSTSGWVALALLCALLTVAALRSGAAGVGLLRLGLSLSVVALLLGALSSALADEQLDGLVEHRVVERLGGLEHLARYEPKDAAALAVFAERPLRLVWGSGVGGVDFYALAHNRGVAVGPRAMITPTYLVVRTLSELGLVGLGLVLVVLWRVGRAETGVMGALIASLGLVALAQPMLTFPAFLFLAGTQVAADGGRAGAALPALPPAHELDGRRCSH